MKRMLYTIIMLLVTLIWAQVTNAQKLPFQGRLLENGEPYNGTVNLVFSINEISWSETHPNVQVMDGLYSLDLGEENPLPQDLFYGVQSRLLSISVNQTQLTPINIYPTFVGNKYHANVVGDTLNSTAISAEISGLGVTDFRYYGGVVKASVENARNTGLYVSATSGQDNQSELNAIGLSAFAENGRNINGQTELTNPDLYLAGQLSSLYGTSNVGGRALQAQYTAFGPGHGVGLSGYSGGGGKNWGVWGRAVSFTDSSQIAGVFQSFGSGNGSHVGVSGSATAANSTMNIGIYGTALNSPNENWAGWFDGDVKITGNLIVEGDSPGTYTLPDTISKSLTGEGLRSVLTAVAEGDGAGSNAGFTGVSRAQAGGNSGLRGYAEGNATTTANHYGVLGIGTVEGAGVGAGLWGIATGGGSATKYGVYGRSQGSGSASSYGVAGFNTSTPTEEGNIWGGLFAATGTGVPNTTNYGVDARATKNAGKNVGIRGYAANGSENWAGWFDGDVKINGSLNLTGSQNNVIEIDEAPDGMDAVSYTITGVGTVNKLYRPLVGTSSVANGLNGGVTGIGIALAGNTNNTYGIFGRATGETTAQLRGVYGEAVSPASSTNWNVGLWGSARGEGTGMHLGLYTNATGTHDNFGALTTATGDGKNNVGIRGLAAGVGDGSTGYGVGSYNTGVQGFARSNSWGNTGVWGYVYNDPTLGGIGVDNIGVIGRSEVNNGTPEMSNIGVKGDAWGSGINKGVVGTAQNGVENWAGWFEGDVKVTGNLVVDGQTSKEFQLITSGNITATGIIHATEVVETSDAQLKINVKPLTNTLENVGKLRGVTFNWASSSSDEYHIGLIAQEVNSVYPEFVRTMPNGSMAINYSQMVSVLIEAIKELNAKVDSLEEQNCKLRSSLDSQEEMKFEMAMLRKLIMELVSKQGKDLAETSIDK